MGTQALSLARVILGVNPQAAGDLAACSLAFAPELRQESEALPHRPPSVPQSKLSRQHVTPEVKF